VKRYHAKYWGQFYEQYYKEKRKLKYPNIKKRKNVLTLNGLWENAVTALTLNAIKNSE